MIHDKSLRRALEREAKGGLTIYSGGGDIWFIGTGWVAKTTEKQLRTNLRKTLGQLVEMLGHMPQIGCVEVQKTSDGYIEQDEMSETVAAVLANFTGEITDLLQRTPLHYRGRAMYQTHGNRIYAESVDAPAIGCRETLLNEKGCIVRCSETSNDMVIVQAYRPEWVKDDPDWEWLEQRLWVDFGPEGEEYDEDQMEVDDET